MTTENIRTFRDVRASDIESVGGKGANLGEMLHAGVPLPDGFCITTAAYMDFLDSPAISSAIAPVLGLISGQGIANIDELSAKIRGAFRAQEISAEMRAGIKRAYESLAGVSGPVAVRSSATAEDLPDASFAGQQESYLNVCGINSLCDAVRECWSSLWTSRAISYRIQKGFRHSEVHLSVVIQKMVRPDVSGVLFTMDPIDAQRCTMLVNASWGLGEAIVSGRVTPDAYKLKREGKNILESQTIGSKEIRIDVSPEGGITECSVSQAHRERCCLGEIELSQLRDTALRVEKHFGRPQDIEWAFEKGRLYILQSRPITSLVPEVDDFRKLSRSERFVLDDILEHFPEAPHPLDYNAVVDTYEQIQSALRELGFEAPLANSVIVMDEEGLCRVSPKSPRLTFGLAKLPGRLISKMRAQPGVWDRDFAPGVKSRLGALAARDLSRLSDCELGEFLDEASQLAAHISKVRFSIVVMPLMLLRVNLSLMARIAKCRIDEFEWLAGLSYHTTQTEMALQEIADRIAAIPEIKSALQCSKPDEITLAKLAQGDMQLYVMIEDFLERFGARTMRLYLPFSARSWSEDQTSLTAVLQSLLLADQKGAAQVRSTAGLARFEKLRDDTLLKLPQWLQKHFLRNIAKFRAFHVEREETVHQIERAWVQARRGVAEMSSRLLSRGCFLSQNEGLFLTTTELISLLCGGLDSATARKLVVQRLDRRSSAQALWKAHRVVRYSSDSANEMRGQPGSPGFAEGRVCIVRTTDEFRKLARGDVLVCPYTDPAWTPLFSLACAVVADTGGPLSHAAIVAREYGIPAVLGLQSGTAQLKDGDYLVVDGTQGVVVRQSR